MIGYRELATIRCVLVLTMLVAVASYAVAQQASNAEEAAVRQAGRTYVEALQQGDATRLAAMWTEAGTYTDADGQTVNARAQIKEMFGSGVDVDAASVPDYSDSSIRFVTPNVAVEKGTYSAQPGGDAAAGQYTAIWVKQDGRWLLDSVNERASGSAADGGPLEELGWMVGRWHGEGDGFTVAVTGRWTEDRRFILRRFTVENEGEQVMSGTQRIGWDPGQQRIRSWVFHTDGGIVEGRWLRDGDAWIVKVRGVLPDGSPISGVDFWLQEGEDRCVFKSHQVEVDGATAKDVVVEFVRVADHRDD